MPHRVDFASEKKLFLFLKNVIMKLALIAIAIN